MPAWNDLLGQARVRAGLSQQELARRAGVAEKTVFNYERGAGRQTRQTLHKLIDALGLDTDAANAILTGAGFEPRPSGALADLAKRRLSLEHLQHEIAQYPWPCLVQNEHMEIVAWNEPAARVAELDFARELPQLYQRNLFRIAVMPHFIDRTLNWEHIVSTMIAMLKNEGTHIARPETESPYFIKLVQDLAAANPQAFNKLWGLWNTVRPYDDDIRVWLHPLWRLSDGTELRFNAVVSSWSDYDAVWAFDWQPADGATWRWLAATAPPDRGGTATPAASAAPASALAATWDELLYAAWEATAMTRAGVAAAAGLKLPTVDKYLYGRSRRPDRAVLLALARALDMDGALTNLVLSRAGHEPEPSQWSRLVAGEAVETDARYRFRHEVPERVRRTDVRRYINEYPWPCLLVNDHCDVAYWNTAAAKLIGDEGLAELRRPGRRNVVHFLLSRYLRERIVNWDEVVTALVPAALREYLGKGAEGDAGRRYRGLIDELRRDDPELLARVQGLWREPRPTMLTARVVVPLVWRRDDGDLLTFTCIISPWTVLSGLWAIDWHPAAGESWSLLARPSC